MKLFYIIICLALLTLGCASKKYVGNEIEASETRTHKQISDVKQMVEETQTKIRDIAKELDLKIDGLESDTKALEGTTKKLNEKTEAQGKEISRMGHISFSKTLSDAEATFKSDSADLSDSAKAELDKFGELIKRQNKMVHIEIQGHTDNRGSESYNLLLGEKRAEAVKDYLYAHHDVPLHLMNTISLGSAQPAVDNDTREHRAQNRRVVLVVRVQI